MIQVVADLSGVKLEVIEGEDNKKKSPHNKFPFIETEDGVIIN